MSMYIRVKRKKTTIFLHVEPTDTVLEVKQKLQDLVEQPPEKQQLFKGTQLLEDARKLAEAKVENDDVKQWSSSKMMAHLNPSTSRQSAQAWKQHDDLLKAFQVALILRLVVGFQLTGYNVVALDSSDDSSSMSMSDASFQSIHSGSGS
eukprot:CAMPEP_0202405868 /NCGR_PEP_ID=MMETSP1128-20130828/7366_1 /ASSEMBLY_ACC=CAM_ASM_000463 /TAXON_ID=3047 /ORGANISM="Dunaliella tertiolecta, Strain CCMP1320" /LENGTH=148 /DNA_ID=CAMNT_0049010579 /DNA_START=127 /DNA_END=574 /DNA_ORIENTATION=-